MFCCPYIHNRPPPSLMLQRSGGKSAQVTFGTTLLGPSKPTLYAPPEVPTLKTVLLSPKPKL